MQAKYPMTQENLDAATAEFSRRVSERDPSAQVDLRWGFLPNEILIIVRCRGGNDGYSLNIVTGEWYRYAIA